MDKAKIIADAKTEFSLHVWDTFVDQPPSIAAGGKGVVVSGSVKCRKRLNTSTQYLDHLFDDVLEEITAQQRGKIIAVRSDHARRNTTISGMHMTALISNQK